MINLLIAGAANHDWRVCQRFEGDHQHQAVDVWQHQIQDDQIRLDTLQHSARLAPGSCKYDVPAMSSQRTGHGAGEGWVVFNQEDTDLSHRGIGASGYGLDLIESFWRAHADVDGPRTA